MRINSPSSLLILVALVASLLVDAAVSQPCFDNTTKIYTELLSADPAESRTFILCPDTIYKIGSLSGGGTLEGGDFPLFAFNNTKYQCGEDGAVTNNCILTGGSVQFIAYNIFEQVSAKNVEIQGLTFEKAESQAFGLGLAGGIFVEDCIIRDNIVPNPVLLFFNAHERRRHLRLEKSVPQNIPWKEFSQQLRDSRDSISSKQHNRFVHNNGNQHKTINKETELVVRDLQQQPKQSDTSQLVIFDRVIFENNQYPEGVEDGFTAGLILVSSVANNFLIISNTLFLNNDYGRVAPLINSYGILSLGANLVKMKDSCFVDNNFVGAGTVVVSNETSLETVNINGVTSLSNSNELVCPFASIVMPDSTYVCEDFDAVSCSLLPQPPTPSPTAYPTQSPTRNPTNFPTKFPTTSPTSYPTAHPIHVPTSQPTKFPTTESPTISPTAEPTKSPSASPTSPPTARPTQAPTQKHTKFPTMSPTRPTLAPTSPPTVPPITPTQAPVVVAMPTKAPVTKPSRSHFPRTWQKATGQSQHRFSHKKRRYHHHWLRNRGKGG